MSILEETVSIFLKRNKIDFIQQKRFDFIGRKSLDFYLPKYKVAIECQGVQHYKDIPFFKSKNQYSRDLNKFKECLTNGIKILYYTDYVNKKIIPQKLKKNTFFNLREILKVIKDGL